MAANNLVTIYNERLLQASKNHMFERKVQNHVSLLNRLALDKELEGHQGCVNCLEWNDTAELLASGSDDFSIIIWNMCKRKMVTRLQTQHEGNIFSVKFQPYTTDSYIASASADSSIRLQYVNTGEQTKCYPCHSKRVKRLCVSRQHPFVIWSGSEDGTVREFDIRESHTCSARSHCNNVLINLMSHVGPSAEVKCIQLHPLNSNYIAVGCTDPYLRLFDRRMLKHVCADDTDTTSQKSLPTGCVKYYSPGHLKLRRNQPPIGNRREKIHVTTYSSFSPDGTELLQNIGGEHIYIYNFNDNAIDEQTIPSSSLNKNHNDLNGCHRNGFNQNGISKTSSKITNFLQSTYSSRRRNFNNNNNYGGEENVDLSDAATALKTKGNEAFSRKKFYQAVYWYNEALKKAPKSSLLFANKAAALLKRDWDGDTYEALRSCEKALEFDDGHVKAMYRQARCLYELKWYKEASECIEKFKEKFPDQKDGSSFRSLEKDLKKYLDKDTLNDADNEDSDNDTSDDSSNLRRRFSYSPYKAEEKHRRQSAIDYRERLVGACNINTDIKEANYFGSNGQYIVGGSDCGCMLLWERSTGNLIEAWHADKSIVNCVQPHPYACVIATSGIDPVVRIWSPGCENEKSENSRHQQVENLSRSNQKRMNMDTFENMIFGYQRHAFFGAAQSDDESETQDQCRTS